jgi:hypothetical protein
MFVRWARNHAGSQFGVTLYTFGRAFWRIEVGFGHHVLILGRTPFYTRRKQEVRDAS